MRVPAKFVASIALAGIALSAVVGHAQGQHYPQKPVRLLVPFSAGSGSDTIGRIVAVGLAGTLGQQVVVDNRAGAAGNIGAELAARAPADGYTLFLPNMGHAANVTMYKNLTYDLLRDFAPVTQLAMAPALLVTHPSLPTRSIPELVKLARTRPGEVGYASGGVGTATFIAAELFLRQAKLNMLHIPYRAGGEALTAVLSGEASVYFAPLAAAMPQARQGRLRALAVTSRERVPVWPDLPTVAQSGFPGYETGNWYGIVVPAKTPADIVARIRQASLAALNDKSVSQRLVDLGYVLIGDTPDQFAAHMRSEIERFSRILRETKQ